MKKLLLLIIVFYAAVNNLSAQSADKKEKTVQLINTIHISLKNYAVPETVFYETQKLLIETGHYKSIKMGEKPNFFQIETMKAMPLYEIERDLKKTGKGMDIIDYKVLN